MFQELGSGSDGGSDEGSDGDSLHSFHYSPKAVDIPSAERLAKRLYHLDGFKKSDVSRHLSKKLVPYTINSKLTNQILFENKPFTVIEKAIRMTSFSEFLLTNLNRL